MKKNLFYLFALICSMSLFTACSDDDEAPDYSITFATANTGIAQLVEHRSPKPSVGSSSLSSRARTKSCN